MIAKTPEPPYYTVIFSSLRTKDKAFEVFETKEFTFVND